MAKFRRRIDEKKRDVVWGARYLTGLREVGNLTRQDNLARQDKT
jgi:hypothetical protein